MANRRLSMRKINEVLRLKWEKGFSARQIADSCDIARSTVKDYLDRAQLKGITWPLPDGLDDIAVEHLLFPSAVQIDTDKRVMPSMEYLHQELKKKRVRCASLIRCASETRRNRAPSPSKLHGRPSSTRSRRASSSR